MDGFPRVLAHCLCAGLTVISWAAPASGSFPLHRWNKDSNPSGLHDYVGHTIAMDASGNAVIGAVGRRTAGTTTFRYVLWKYASNGGLVWQREYTGVQHASSYPVYVSNIRVAVDAVGNLVLTGGFRGTIDFGGGPMTSTGSYNDIFLVKLDGSGNFIWGRQFGSTPGEASFGVGVTTEGHIVIGGTHGGIDFGGGALPATGDAFNFFRAEFDGDGVHQASRTFPITGSAVNARVGDMAVDGNGTLYITGQFYAVLSDGVSTLTTAGGTDIFLIAYAADGSRRLFLRFGGTGSDTGADIAVADDGDVLLTGAIRNSVSFGGPALPAHCDSRFFAARLTSAGAHRWSRSDLASCGTASIGTGIAAGPSGRTVVVGRYAGSGAIDCGTGPMQNEGNNDAFVASFNATGSPEWAGRYGTSANQGADAAAFFPDGDACVAGTFSGSILTCSGMLSASLRSLFVLKLQPEVNTDQTPPSVPANPTYDGHFLRWDPSTDPEGSPVWYTVEELGVYFRTYTWAAHEATTSYEDYLTVYATDCVGNRSAHSVRVEVNPPWTEPAAPTGLAYDGAVLTWDAAPEPDVIHYVVHGSPTGEWDDGLRTRLGLTSETSLDVSQAGAAYYFVTAVDEALNWGDHTRLRDDVAPLTPTGFAKQANRLVWDAPTDPGWDYYSLYGSPTADFASPTLIVTTRKHGIYLDPPKRFGYYRLTLTDMAGNASAPASVTGYTVTALLTDTPRYPLALNVWPNPAPGLTTIRFTLPSAGAVAVRIYDARGALVVSLVDAMRAAGEHREGWNGRTASGSAAVSGVYFARLEFAGEAKIQKVVLVR
jgi:hypothetical protein